ncbi:MAG TPA: DUF2235 domain-containing protein [Candidatus Binatia bacterium]|nr:DUF2235 domain-containing protein [Candidatus Binatia bacterium]
MNEQAVNGHGLRDPDGRPGKRIVVCTDGTWNDPLRGNVTNVVKLARAVRRRDDRGIPQIVYYHSGVGTGTDVVDRILGGSVGLGISRNIRDAYGFIVQNYERGDEIFLFGFSRGAYTARSLAGLIRNAGILRPNKGHKFRDAYELYRSPDEADHPKSERSATFRATNSYGETSIKFVGVWDTVGALGVPLGFGRYAVRWYGALTGRPILHEFHDVELSSYVDHAYHAVAMHERREPFRPTLWQTQPDRRPDQSFEQVWFRGVHCNVGGGYEAAGLSDVALEWMAKRAERHGLALDLRLLHPCPDPDLSPEPDRCQRWSYQLVGILKKWNAHTLKIGLTDVEIAERDRIDWLGNYRRDVGTPTIEEVLRAESRGTGSPGGDPSSPPAPLAAAAPSGAK